MLVRKHPLAQDREDAGQRDAAGNGAIRNARCDCAAETRRLNSGWVQNNRPHARKSGRGLQHACKRRRSAMRGVIPPGCCIEGNSAMQFRGASTNYTLWLKIEAANDAEPRPG